MKLISCIMLIFLFSKTIMSQNEREKFYSGINFNYNYYSDGSSASDTKEKSTTTKYQIMFFTGIRLFSRYDIGFGMGTKNVSKKIEKNDGLQNTKKTLTTDESILMPYQRLYPIMRDDFNAYFQMHYKYQPYQSYIGFSSGFSVNPSANFGIEVQFCNFDYSSFHGYRTTKLTFIKEAAIGCKYIFK